MIFCFLLISTSIWADNTRGTATNLGTLSYYSGALTRTGQVNQKDVNDYYKFTTAKQNVKIVLDRLNDDANLGLYDKSGRMLGMSTKRGTQADQIQLSLAPGTYFVRVAAVKAPPAGPWSNAFYRVSVSGATRPVIINPPNPPRKPIVITPIPTPVPKIYIRGIPYNDYSATTTLSPSSVSLGQYFTITTSNFPWNSGGTLKVFMQDVTRGNGYGVTGFQLRNVRRQGNRLTVQAPRHQTFKNRSFYVTVFHYPGTTNNYASAGTIRFQ